MWPEEQSRAHPPPSPKVNPEACLHPWALVLIPGTLLLLLGLLWNQSLIHACVFAFSKPRWDVPWASRIFFNVIYRLKAACKYSPTILKVKILRSVSRG